MFDFVAHYLAPTIRKRRNLTPINPARETAVALETNQGYIELALMII